MTKVIYANALLKLKVTRSNFRVLKIYEGHDLDLLIILH